MDKEKTEKVQRACAAMIGALVTAYKLLPCSEGKKHYLFIGDDDEFHLNVWVEEKKEWADVLTKDGYDMISRVENLAGKINHDRRRKLLKVVK